MVDLILEMKRLGHPSFAGLDEALVRQRAEALPEDGVPKEVLKVIEEVDDSHDRLQPQKAATPCDGRQPLAAAGQAFAAQRPRTVEPQGRSNRPQQELVEAALKDLTTQLTSPGDMPALRTLEARAGNRLIDQFQPYYWSMAFCFLFKYATAQPDVSKTSHGANEEPTSRRMAGDPRAPKVDFTTWGGAMLRQVASQFRRDWNFAPAIWNYMFRTMVNLQPNAHVYTVHDVNGARQLTNEDISKGAIELYEAAAKGKYLDVNGEMKAVQGDLTKLRHVPGLSQAALKVLSNTEARARNVPGTHEIRKIMRQQTHSCRIVHGSAIFVTFSPSERDTTIMLKMARARATDPAIGKDPAKAFYQRDQPALDEEFMRLSPEMLAEDRLYIISFRISVFSRRAIQIHFFEHILLVLAFCRPKSP